MSEFLYTLVNTQSFWIITVVWVVVCIAWVERWRPPLYRVEKLVGKPIIFKRDPDFHNPPFYPRSLMEDIANGFRDTLRKPFIDLKNVASNWMSNLAVILHSKDNISKLIGYVALSIGWLIIGILVSSQ